MTTYQTTLVVGIFENEIQAKNAVDTLRTAGLHYDQVGVAMSSSTNATPDLQADLIKLGIPEEQAKYYDNAYWSGKIVVSVRPDGQENETSDILSSNGAQSYEPQDSVENAPVAESSTPEHAATPETFEDNLDQGTHDEVTPSSTQTEDQ
ncbi:hypothetical protein KDA_23410 [Dictyobacter alpinus]|uniref:General stress protein 17M-like domain-containing protein n=1 Tax=Dictyobacter alpinus TaxID=2014873 RepID=A0A402B6A6_9CHLR|nr:hypothetical protein [Dictyobacter alpinus]GCE26857.1 hypothetical protein KDA_23410 [Dictyobacter alpinus]